MADDDEGRYTVADCMDETTARSIAFILNYECIEQILQSHTEEQDRADKAEGLVMHLEKINSGLIDRILILWKYMDSKQQKLATKELEAIKDTTHG